MRGRLWEWNAVAGKPFHESTEENAVLVGTGLGKMMGCEASVNITNIMRREGGYIPAERPFTCERPSLQLSASTEAAQVNALDLKVIGIVDGGFREQDKYWVILPLTLAQKLLDTDKVTTISVRLKNKKHIPEFVQRVKKQLLAKGLDLDVIPWKEHQVGSFMRGSMDITNTFRNLFMVIVVTICVLSVSNTMMKAVTERTREIGSLRSFGFLQREIATMFAFEGMFLAMLSCFFGVLVTILASIAINFSGVTYKAIFLTVALNPVVWALNTLWLTILAAGTAWLCSRKAAKMVIADAMRHV
jgi:putative ABC transport system permease protein